MQQIEPSELKIARLDLFLVARRSRRASIAPTGQLIQARIGNMNGGARPSPQIAVCAFHCAGGNLRKILLRAATRDPRRVRKWTTSGRMSTDNGIRYFASVLDCRT